MKWSEFKLIDGWILHSSDSCYEDLFILEHFCGGVCDGHKALLKDYNVCSVCGTIVSDKVMNAVKIKLKFDTTLG